jgi:hypothetical protein
MSVISDGFQSSADESDWLKVSEGITTEMAEECSVEEAAGIAVVMVGLMEECSANSNRLPRSAADVLQVVIIAVLAGIPAIPHLGIIVVQ